MVIALVVGGGGREHAIAHALKHSSERPELLIAPGNPGTAALGENVPIGATDVAAMVALAKQRQVDLVVVGPEAPLAAGLADALTAAQIPVFGASQAAARLESSKAFAKAVMHEAGVETARGESFSELEPALAFLAQLGGRAVVKADGLAAGKGVVVADSLEEAEDATRRMLQGALGAAGQRVVIEERLEGEEVSIMAISDGERYALLPAAQDHKRIFDGDRGPNTGGMGAYAPAPAAAAIFEEAGERTIAPVLRAMAKRGTPFRGVLYAGLMLTSAGPKVLEYNARLGDPETEAMLPLLADDLLPILQRAAAGRLDPGILRTRPGAAMTVVLASEGYPESPRTGDAIEGLGAVGPEVLVFHAGTKRDPDGTLRTAGGRVLALTAVGSSLEAAREAVYRGAAAIRFRGMQYRRDIGARALRRS
ncbi:MAG: phosphoribosylamine--glycine ligase [Myxococcota bacterium]